MSGHSKWSNIKRAKGAKDIQRGALFTKLAHSITLAAQQGDDPKKNFSLRSAIDRARAANMPSNNIEKAVKKGMGGLAGKAPVVSITYEGYGPGSVALLIECKTDNTNRAITEVRQLLDKGGGKLTAGGSVSWQFIERGLLVVKPRAFELEGQLGQADKYKPVALDQALLDLMEVPGVIDVTSEEGEVRESMIEVVSDRDLLHSVRQAIENKGYRVERAELTLIPKETVAIDEATAEKLEKLVTSLENSAEVVNVWHNAVVRKG